MARWTAGTVFDLRRWSNGDAVVGRVLLPLIDIISDVDMCRDLLGDEKQVAQVACREDIHQTARRICQKLIYSPASHSCAFI